MSTRSGLRMAATLAALGVVQISLRFWMRFVEELAAAYAPFVAQTAQVGLKLFMVQHDTRNFTFECFYQGSCNQWVLGSLIFLRETTLWEKLLE